MIKSMMVLVAVLGAAAAGRAADAVFKLEYRATPKPILYNLQSVSMKAEHAPGGTPNWDYLDLRQTLSQEVTATPEGTLSVVGTVIGAEASNGATHVDLPAPEKPETISAGITKRGERLDTPGAGEPVAVLMPVLPDGAAKPGQTWETEWKAQPGVPAMKVKHELVGVEPHEGQLCAFVVSEAEGKDEGAGSSYKGHGRIVLSLNDGALVEATHSVSMAQRVTGKDGTPVIKRLQLMRLMGRRSGEPLQPNPGK